MKLKYIGNGAAFVGVPARDLTEDEVKILSAEFDIDKLISSGLYKKEETEQTPKSIKASKERE